MDDISNLRPMNADVDPIAYLKKIKAANRQKRFRDNHPEHIEKKKAYDAQRKGRSGKSVMSKRRSGGHFVAIDAEGFNINNPICVDKDNNRVYVNDIKSAAKKHAMYQDHRTCLWMAGGVEGIPNKTAVSLTGFNSEEIMSWLLGLPQHFDRAIKQYSGFATDEQPIFIAFGFGYDVGQIVKDMPFEKRWEVNAGKPWSQRNNPSYISDLRAYPVLYKDFALYYIPGKMITLFRLKTRISRLLKTTKAVKRLIGNSVFASMTHSAFFR
jgi:hypothetical protein